MNLRLIIPFLVLISTITAIITFRVYKKTPERLFLGFLLLTTLVELLGYIPALLYFYPENMISVFLTDHFPNKMVKKNFWLFNTYRIYTFIFYQYYYYTILKEKWGKMCIKLIMTAFVLISVFEIGDFFAKNMILMRMSGTIFLVCSAGLYLKEVFNGNEIFSFYKTLPFWISLGGVTYYSITTPLFIFADVLKFSHQVYLEILLLCNIVLYGSFITGFLIQRRVERGKIPF